MKKEEMKGKLCSHGFAYVWKETVNAYGTCGCKHFCIVKPEDIEDFYKEVSV